MVAIRQALPAPEADDASLRRIDIRHPAYPDTNPALLRLNAVDDGGVDYDIAFVACCIVTGNTWARAWLATRDADGRLQRAARPPDGVLREATYYLCLGADVAEQYPVLPSFDHWRFPHNGMPAPWSGVTIPPAPPNAFLKHKIAAAARDGSCRITARVDACEVGHLVPLVAGHWFASNNMEQYCRLGFDHRAIDDEKNALVLCKDVHRLLDTRWLVFAAKQKQTSGAGPPPC